jgi:hypothetical protein
MALARPSVREPSVKTRKRSAGALLVSVRFGVRFAACWAVYSRELKIGLADAQEGSASPALSAPLAQAQRAGLRLPFGQAVRFERLWHEVQLLGAAIHRRRAGRETAGLSATLQLFEAECACWHVLYVLKLVVNGGSNTCVSDSDL